MPKDNDDWNHISDSASRKRVQNRIAQRNYRNNQKKRIEQLEYFAMAARLGQEAAGYDLTRQPFTSSLLPPGQLLPPHVSSFANDSNHVLPQVQRPQGSSTRGSSINRPRTRSSPYRSSISSDKLPNDEPDAAVETNQDTTSVDDEVTSGTVEGQEDLTTNKKFDDTIHVFPTPSALGHGFSGDEGWYESNFPSMIHQGDFMLQNKEGDNGPRREVRGEEPQRQELHLQSAQLPCPVFPNVDLQLKRDAKPLPTLPDDASIQQRFDYVSLCAKTAGFKSLESMISSYYTSNFQEEVPALASSQRLDRNRRLPRLLAEICDNMNTWSSWEARGCKEELLKVAETVFLNEFDVLTANPELHVLLSDTGLTSKYSDKKSRAELVSRIESVFQKEVPNLWAFFSVLTENCKRQPNATGKKKTYTAFGLISLMYCSRTGTGSGINNLVKSCLDVD